MLLLNGSLVSPNHPTGMWQPKDLRTTTCVYMLRVSCCALFTCFVQMPYKCTQFGTRGPCDTGKFTFSLICEDSQYTLVQCNTKVTEKILFWCLPKVGSILEYTSKQAMACNIDYRPRRRCAHFWSRKLGPPGKLASGRPWEYVASMSLREDNAML